MHVIVKCQLKENCYIILLINNKVKQFIYPPTFYTLWTYICFMEMERNNRLIHLFCYAIIFIRLECIICIL